MKVSPSVSVLLLFLLDDDIGIATTRAALTFQIDRNLWDIILILVVSFALFILALVKIVIEGRGTFKLRSEIFLVRNGNFVIELIHIDRLLGFWLYLVRLLIQFCNWTFINDIFWVNFLDRLRFLLSRIFKELESFFMCCRNNAIVFNDYGLLI